MSDFNATKELIQFVVELVKAIEQSIADGVSALDAVNFIKPVLLAIDTFKDVDKIPAELKNLTEEQVRELYGIVEASLDDTSKPQQVIEKSLEIGVKLFELYKMIKS